MPLYTPSTGSGSGAPITACELMSSTSFSSFQRLFGWTQRALTDQRLFVTPFVAPRTQTAATISVFVDGTGTSSTSTSVGLYSIDASDNGTLLSSATGATTVFNTQGLKTFTLSAPQALTAGERYAVGILQNGGSPAGLCGCSGGGNAQIRSLVPSVGYHRDTQTAQGNFTAAQMTANFFYFWFQISA
jgi:hypothetical protein